MEWPSKGTSETITQRKYSIRIDCHPSGCSKCTKLETSTWFCVSNRKNTWGWEPGGRNRSSPTCCGLQCRSGGLCVFCPCTPELCRVSSLVYQCGCSLSMGDIARVQFNYKPSSPTGCFRLLCLALADRNRLPWPRSAKGGMIAFRQQVEYVWNSSDSLIFGVSGHVTASLEWKWCDCQGLRSLRNESSGHLILSAAEA